MRKKKTNKVRKILSRTPLIYLDIFRLLTGLSAMRCAVNVLWNEDMIYRVFSMCRFELILTLVALVLCVSTYVAHGDYYYCIIRCVLCDSGEIMVVVVMVVVCSVFV